MLRVTAWPWLAVFLAVWATAPAGAVPYITKTLFGDGPAQEYVAPPVAEEITTDKVVAKTPGAGDDQIRAPRTNSNNSDAARSAQVRALPPDVVLEGFRSAPTTGVTEAPLASGYAMTALTDDRLIEEANEQARVRLAMSDEQMPAPVSADEISAAVREGARAARDSDEDESVQREIQSELEQEPRLIKFEFVEMGEMGELVDEGGVLGLVSVTKVIDEDKKIVDEEGHVVIVESEEAENEIVKWKGESALITKAGGVPVSELGLLSDAGTAAAVRKLVSPDFAGNSATTGDQLSRAVVASASVGTYLGNTDSFRQVVSKPSNLSDQRMFSVEQLLLFLRLIFQRVETYMGLIAIIAVAFFFKRFARAS